MGAGFCGSWLACDADASVIQLNRGDVIAGKPAPTQAAPTVVSGVYPAGSTSSTQISPASG
ncbi:MAG: hypothetical protein CFE47_23740 [Pseudomonas sp. PGPPP1]|nr:MAG: hypothetical protein CFE47_23740 [Pseudomonas sp. PGPPP1]